MRLLQRYVLGYYKLYRLLTLTSKLDINLLFKTKKAKTKKEVFVFVLLYHSQFWRQSTPDKAATA